VTHLPSFVLAQHLVNQGFGVWWDTRPKPAPAVFRVSYGSMADEDDRAISVLDLTAKQQDARSHRTGGRTEFPGIQVRVRGLTDREVNTKFDPIVKNLDALFRQPVNLEGTNYCIQNCSRQYDPTFLMQEEKKNRRVWVIAANLTIWEES
jgi:hypothetical protein